MFIKKTPNKPSTKSGLFLGKIPMWSPGKNPRLFEFSFRNFTKIVARLKIKVNKRREVEASIKQLTNHVVDEGQAALPNDTSPTSCDEVFPGLNKKSSFYKF